jgi:hypothetical protein
MPLSLPRTGTSGALYFNFQVYLHHFFVRLSGLVFYAPLVSTNQSSALVPASIVQQGCTGMQAAIQG